MARPNAEPFRQLGLSQAVCGADDFDGFAVIHPPNPCALTRPPLFIAPHTNASGTPRRGPCRSVLSPDTAVVKAFALPCDTPSIPVAPSEVARRELASTPQTPSIAKGVRLSR